MSENKTPDKEQTLPDTPPNRFVDLGGYIKWFMDKEGRRTFNDPATMGLVLRMQEWEKIVSALSEVSSARGDVSKVIEAARELQTVMQYSRGMADGPGRGPGNRLADALYEYDQSSYVGEKK